MVTRLNIDFFKTRYSDTAKCNKAIDLINRYISFINSIHDAKTDTGLLKSVQEDVTALSVNSKAAYVSLEPYQEPMLELSKEIQSG